MVIKKAVIPAAGLGTRLLPATKAQPKEMLPVVDRPVIQYVVEEAIASGIEDLLIVTGRGKRSLEDHLDRSIELETYLKLKKDFTNLDIIANISKGPATYYIRQKEPKGLGDAILAAEHHISDEPFAIMLGDDICVSEPSAMSQLITFYKKNPGIVIALEEVEDERVSLYGIVAPSKSIDNMVIIEDLVEKPDPEKAPSNLAIIGRYILVPEIFESLKTTAFDERGELQLTDAIKNLIGKVPIYGYKLDGKCYDVGNKLSYLTTNIELALTRDDIRDDLMAFLKELMDKMES